MGNYVIGEVRSFMPSNTYKITKTKSHKLQNYLKGTLYPCLFQENGEDYISH